MKNQTYQQCTLQKCEGVSILTRIIWGPSEFTKVGREVKVEEDDGSWTHNWVVVAVHGEPLPEKYVKHQSHAYARQRKHSDI